MATACGPWYRPRARISNFWRRLKTAPVLGVLKFRIPGGTCGQRLEAIRTCWACPSPGSASPGSASGLCPLSTGRWALRASPSFGIAKRPISFAQFGGDFRFAQRLHHELVLLRPCWRHGLVPHSRGAALATVGGALLICVILPSSVIQITPKTFDSASNSMREIWSPGSLPPGRLGPFWHFPLSFG